MEKNERRFYERVFLGIDGCAYHKGVELSCTIKDICEEGICILINKDELNNFHLENCFKNNDIIKFSFFGNYESMKKEDVECFISGECKIIRIDYFEDKISFGCFLMKNKSLDSFVKNKKIEIFLKKYIYPFTKDVLSSKIILNYGRYMLSFAPV